LEVLIHLQVEAVECNAVATAALRVDHCLAAVVDVEHQLHPALSVLVRLDAIPTNQGVDGPLAVFLQLSHDEKRSKEFFDGTPGTPRRSPDAKGRAV
jgi:hypothetical protein